MASCCFVSVRSRSEQLSDSHRACTCTLGHPGPSSVRLIRPGIRRPPRANRSAAGASAMAFRGINGGLPAAAARRWVPSIYSTLPLRTHSTAALSVSRGDRRMRGRTQLNTTLDVEESTAIEYPFAAPSEFRAVGFWTNPNQRGELACHGRHGATAVVVSLRSVAMRDQREDVWLPDGVCTVGRGSVGRRVQ